MGPTAPPSINPFWANHFHNAFGGYGNFQGANHAYLDGHVAWQGRGNYPDIFRSDIASGGNATMIMDGLYGYPYSWWWIIP